MKKMEEWSREQWEETMKTSALSAFYLYTPLCGTCAVASKMMEVVEHVVSDIPIGKANLNYIQDVAFDYEVESVPCLIISKNGKVHDKIYAFQSVPFLFEKLRQND